MQSLYPSPSALSASFAHASPYQLHYQPRQQQKKSIAHLYGSWDAAEDAKNKATQLSDAATAELKKASELAQQKTGKIELYSPKYYAAW